MKNTPNLSNDYFGSGYGVPTAEAQAAADRFKKIGIQLESTYSAKATAAMIAIQASTDGPILFWNTFNSRDASHLITTPPQ